MAQGPSQPSKNANNNISEDVIKEFLAAQKEEFKFKHDEMMLRREEQQQSYELAKENLRLQGEYLKGAPRHITQNKLIVLGFIFLVLLTIIGLIIFCINKGKEELAVRIMELAAAITFSGSGGYFFGKSRRIKKHTEDNPDEIEQ